jgi:pyruvate formate lyase activating enzyme
MFETIAEKQTDSPVFAFQKQPTMIDYRGHYAALFFIAGCNFRCGFCHNASLLAGKKKGIGWDRLRDYCEQLKEQWVDAVVLTGGEPTLHPELPELIHFFKDQGFLIKLDTNGSDPFVLSSLIHQIDYIAMDVKTSLDAYPVLTGFQDVDLVRQSIQFLKSSTADYEFRTTVIESFHTDRMIMQMLREIEGAARYVLQPFIARADCPNPDLRHAERTSVRRLQEIAKLAERYIERVDVIGV